MTGSRPAKSKDFDRILDSIGGQNPGFSGQFRGGCKAVNVTVYRDISALRFREWGSRGRKFKSSHPDQIETSGIPGVF